MTPKEKAEELILKYLKIKTHKIFNGWWHKITAKQCALIAVEQIQNLCWGNNQVGINYWNDVKNEIEKL
jgi:hypothetical protein